MEKILNYKILEKIEETKYSILYRGQKEGEAETVIIKVLRTSNPSPSEVARFKQECNEIKEVDLSGVVKIYEFVDDRDGFALVLEDLDPVSLKSIIDSEKISIDVFSKDSH